MDRQNPRTNGKRKAMQTKSQKEACTYTLTKIEKGKNNIYLYKNNKRTKKSVNKSTNDNKL